MSKTRASFFIKASSKHLETDESTRPTTSYFHLFLELVMKHSTSFLTYDVNYVKVLDETMYNATHSSCKLFKPLKDPMKICDISLPGRDL